MALFSTQPRSSSLMAQASYTAKLQPTVAVPKQQPTVTNLATDKFEKSAPIQAEAAAISTIKSRSGSSDPWGIVLSFNEVTGLLEETIKNLLNVDSLSGKHSVNALELLQQELERIVITSLTEIIAERMPKAVSQNATLIAETLWQNNPQAQFELIKGKNPSLQMALQLTPPFLPYHSEDLKTLQEDFERKVQDNLATNGLRPSKIEYVELPSPQSRVKNPQTFKEYMEKLAKFEELLNGEGDYEPDSLE